MTGDPRVLGLLEEMLDAGRTPEEVCRDCPELLAEVRERWREFRLIDAAVVALVPGLRAPSAVGVITPVTPSADLPQVPGYDVEAVLGCGGMGVVYKARQRALDRVVAVKMLPPGAFAGSRELGRFRQETAALACLRHPNIVQVYDAGDVDGRPYFVMEYVEGGNLAWKLAGAPQPARRAAELLATLAEAVEAAHRAGVVHRDLKPANVLLTADGTPKVSDFGLARRLEGGEGLTRSGAAVGTPSYMAPEQAEGEAGTIGPGTDVYALGVVLYECLTGRPPFRAESDLATVYQVVTREPVPPSRLNHTVPRDLETICLTCLRKQPGLRYRSAAGLAEDLGRFLRGEAISARPEGVWRRFARRVRRRPGLSAAIAAVTGLTLVLAGGSVWILSERSAAARGEAATEQAVDDDLAEMSDLIQKSQWSEARAAWERASGRLGDRTSADLRRRLDQGKRDIDMAAVLEKIRLRLTRSTVPLSPENMYAQAYRDYGIDLLTLDPAESAARIRDSAIRDTLVAFLHDWLYWIADANRPQVRATADLADGDDWRRAYREAIAAKNADVEKFKVLAAQEAAGQPSVVISGLCGSLMAHNYRDEALAVLGEAHRRYPGDYWINFLLGHFWEKDRPQQAVGYLRAAVALRPTSDQAFAKLANALRDSGDPDGAVHAYRRAIELHPDADLMRDLAKLLGPRGKPEAVRAAWAKTLDRNPPDHPSWYGYAQLCLFLDDEEAFRRNRTAMLNRFLGADTDWYAAERISLACLLRPAEGDELDRVVEMVNRAVTIGPKPPDPDHAYIQFVQGLAEYRQGRPAQAIPLLEPAAARLFSRPGPRLVLAMAQFRAGFHADARRTLASAVLPYDWNDMQSDPPTIWVNHVLRREAEGLILPNLTAFLDGAYRPKDPDERRALLAACRVTDRSFAVARAFADAFAADPRLTEAVRDGHRYAAARAAARIGCGRSPDAAGLPDPERVRWREQARTWLRADLAAWAKVLDGDPTGARQDVRQQLTRWRADPELTGLREPAELDRLPTEERKDCLALWAEVADLLGRCRP
jgi:serine/threonine-protein kinase